MCVCVCVCVSVCMYGCGHVCVCVRACALTLYFSQYMGVRKSICMNRNIFKWLNIYTYISRYTYRPIWEGETYYPCHCI